MCKPDRCAGRSSPLPTTYAQIEQQSALLESHAIKQSIRGRGVVLAICGARARGTVATGWRGGTARQPPPGGSAWPLTPGPGRGTQASGRAAPGQAGGGTKELAQVSVNRLPRAAGPPTVTYYKLLLPGAPASRVEVVNFLRVRRQVALRVDRGGLHRRRRRHRGTRILPHLVLSPHNKLQAGFQLQRSPRQQGRAAADGRCRRRVDGEQQQQQRHVGRRRSGRGYLQRGGRKGGRGQGRELERGVSKPLRCQTAGGRAVGGRWSQCARPAASLPPPPLCRPQGCTVTSPKGAAAGSRWPREHLAIAPLQGPHSPLAGGGGNSPPAGSRACCQAIGSRDAVGAHQGDGAQARWALCGRSRLAVALQPHKRTLLEARTAARHRV